jgi:hypothetical protein
MPRRRGIRWAKLVPSAAIRETRSSLLPTERPQVRSLADHAGVCPVTAPRGTLLLAPAAIMLLVHVVSPYLAAVVIGLRRKLIDSTAAPRVGFGNYVALLTDPTFWIVARKVQTPPSRRSRSRW